MATDTKHKVKIKIRAFPYYVDDIDPVSGNPVRRELVARRGDEIELSDLDYERATRFDAITEPEGTTTDPATGAAVDVASNIDVASPEEVATWLKESKPTIDETVAAAEDDPMKAKKLLEAENLVTGRQPRQGVLNGLNAIIQGDATEPPPTAKT